MTLAASSQHVPQDLVARCPLYLFLRMVKGSLDMAQLQVEEEPVAQDHRQLIQDSHSQLEYLDKAVCVVYRGSYMSAHVLLNLLNELRKRDQMRGLPSILSLFRNEFKKFNNTRARLLENIYHMTNTLKSHFWRKNVILLSLCTQSCYGRHNVSRKSINH